MLAVKRLGYVTLTTPDIERQVEYYVRVLGLSLVDREKKRAILATKAGQEAVLLEQGADAACVRLALQVAPGSDLVALASKLSTGGIKVEHRSGITPRVAQAIAFEDPKGTIIEVYSDCEFCPPDSSDIGIASRKLGHVAFNTTDVKRVVDFYCQVLGFRVSDWRTDVFAFLRCGPDHHSVNFVLGEKTSVHHVAFEVRDEAEISRSCDLLAKKDFRLTWGPIRHIIGHSISTYHKNPDGVVMELFTDLDTMLSEELGYFEPRPWHQDRPQRPKVWPETTPANWWGPASRWRGPEEDGHPHR
jgi:catechol 2,3-dioxygenase-like lactoylglutathione lyase family enzyme